MPTDEVPGINEISQTPGLAGGPGPTPPGLDDGTPKPVEGDDEGTGAVPQGGTAQKRAGEIAERSAGTRRADVDQAERQADPDPQGGADEPRRHASAPGAEWRDPEEPDPS